MSIRGTKDREKGIVATSEQKSRSYDSGCTIIDKEESPVPHTQGFYVTQRPCVKTDEEIERMWEYEKMMGRGINL